MTQILDAQLHAQSQEIIESHLEMLDAAAVDGALLVQTVPQGFDNGLLLAGAAAHPEGLGVVGVLDARAADIREQVSAWRETPGAIGLRLVVLDEERTQMLRHGTYDRLLAEAEASRVPIFVYAPRLVEEVEAIAGRFPALPIVLDHLGLPQPPVLESGEVPFANLDRILTLARFENVGVKLTALPLVAGEAYPFDDLWPRIHAVLEAFGVERAMWGSDQTRECIDYEYASGVDYVRSSGQLNDGEKEAILGGTLRAWCHWNPSPSLRPVSTGPGRRRDV